MEVLRKEISAKVDLVLDTRLQELHQDNKQLFLNSRFERYRSDEITRQNENLACEIELLQKLFDEQNDTNKKQQEMLLTKNKTKVSRLNDEIKSLRSKLEAVERQLIISLQNESNINRTVCEQELTIKSDVRFKKMKILEEEKVELVHKLHQSVERESEKEFDLREHKLQCSKTIDQLKMNIVQLEFQVDDLERKNREKEKKWRVEQDAMEKKQKQYWIALEEEKLSSKLQVASVQNVKDIEVSKIRNSCIKYKTRSRQFERKLEHFQNDVTRLSKDVERYDEESKRMKSKLIESEKLLTEKSKKLDVKRQTEKSIRKKANKYKEQYQTDQKQLRKLSKENEEIKVEMESKIEEKCKKVVRLKHKADKLLADNERLSVFKDKYDSLDIKSKDQDIMIKKQEMEIKRLTQEILLMKVPNKQKENCTCNNDKPFTLQAENEMSDRPTDIIEKNDPVSLSSKSSPNVTDDKTPASGVEQIKTDQNESSVISRATSSKPKGFCANDDDLYQHPVMPVTDRAIESPQNKETNNIMESDLKNEIISEEDKISIEDDVDDGDDFFANNNVINLLFSPGDSDAGVELSEPEDISSRLAAPDSCSAECGEDDKVKAQMPFKLSLKSDRLNNHLAMQPADPALSATATFNVELPRKIHFPREDNNHRNYHEALQNLKSTLSDQPPMRNNADIFNHHLQHPHLDSSAIIPVGVKTHQHQPIHKRILNSNHNRDQSHEDLNPILQRNTNRSSPNNSHQNKDRKEKISLKGAPSLISNDRGSALQPKTNMNNLSSLSGAPNLTGGKSFR